MRRPAQELRPGEILLDEADGLDRLAVFDCLLFPVVKKAAISAVIGHVSTERKRHLHRTLVGALRLFSQSRQRYADFATGTAGDSNPLGSFAVRLLTTESTRRFATKPTKPAFMPRNGSRCVKVR